MVFGLFTSTPSLRKHVGEAVPVVWLTQMALWPELLERFLHMIRCSPVMEDRDGKTQPVQRLLPHPDAAWPQRRTALRDPKSVPKAS